MQALPILMSINRAPIQQQQQQQHHHHHHQQANYHPSETPSSRDDYATSRAQFIPPMPPIKTVPGQPVRSSPLTIEEYERNFRSDASDLELIERVFEGGLASNQLRAALWPYIFGLVKHRGRFKLARTNPPPDNNSTKTTHHVNHNGNHSSSNNNTTYHKTTTRRNEEYVYEEHANNLKTWKKLKQIYYLHESQWRSITPDQELRFSTFRDRKALIERDVIRSDRLHPFYADNNQNLTALTRLLMTYMIYDFDVGYLQGMSDLAAPILYIFDGDPVKSFWLFVQVMKLVRRNFEYTQKTIHFQLSCLFRLIKMTDYKFARYLYENESSNCFFAFRCIACLFKRELMKNDDDEEDENYSKVLKLWDTIWCVQRRHELLAAKKIIHTYTIANGHTTNRAQPHNGTSRNYAITNGNGNSSPDSYTSRTSQSSPHWSRKSLSNSRIDGYPMANSHSNGSGAVNGFESRISDGCYPINGFHHSTRAAKTNSTPSNYSKSSSPRAGNKCKSPMHSIIKQEEIVYRKNPTSTGGALVSGGGATGADQIDKPRFDLTETEKFVLSLCLSLIRRQRNRIMQQRLDASEIHQHFANPRLARDLDNFIESAYQIYHYLNTDCDMQSLIKGCARHAKLENGCLSPASVADQINLDSTPGLAVSCGGSPKTGDMADTYDLLRDYLIISPSSYNEHSTK